MICPEHGIPDCSPLLNGCSRVTTACEDCQGTGGRKGYHDGLCRCRGMFHVCRSYRCPTCDGTGKKIEARNGTQ